MTEENFADITTMSISVVTEHWFCLQSGPWRCLGEHMLRWPCHRTERSGHTPER